MAVFLSMAPVILLLAIFSVSLLSVPIILLFRQNHHCRPMAPFEWDRVQRKTDARTR